MILFMDKSLHLLLLTNSYVSNEDGFVTVSQMTDRRRKTSHHHHVYALKSISLFFHFSFFSFLAMDLVKGYQGLEHWEGIEYGDETALPTPTHCSRKLR